MSTTQILILFNLGILAFLALDLGLFQRRAHAISLREAALWTSIWIALSLLFNAFVWFRYGSQSGIEFFTAYVLEKSLAMDNLAVFALIFTSLAIPAKDQHRVLFWGALAALPMRAMFIVAGVALLSRFDWILYIFGAFLLITAIRLWFKKDAPINTQNNSVIRFASRFFPVTSETSEPTGSKFFVREGGRRFATPLFVALLLVESADLIFAVDSIPAVFTVTRSSFIAYTSNALAVLGLRSMYFLLAGALSKLRYLHAGLCVVLAFLGVKMLISHFYDLPTLCSLGAIFLILGIAALASLLSKSPASSSPPPPTPH
jgi:tellurite resistance protein TerC